MGSEPHYLDSIQCGECGKDISSDEYAVNWGSCGPCFDAGYESYLATLPAQLEFDFPEPVVDFTQSPPQSPSATQ